MKASPGNRLAVIAITAAIVLSTCCSLFALGARGQSWNWQRPLPQANTSPATVVYMWGRYGYGNPCLNGYSTADGSLVSQLDVPDDACYGPFETDTQGQIYVTAPSHSNPGTEQVLVYAAGANGSASPIRTIQLADPWSPYNFAIDPVGNLYMVSAVSDGSKGYIYQVHVYPTTPRSSSTPVRTLQLRDMLAPIRDIAADAQGNIYVAGYLKTATFYGWVVAIYQRTAHGISLPSRVIDFSGYHELFGVAVDGKNHIFVNVSSFKVPPTTLAVQEFDLRRGGPAALINTINLPESNNCGSGGAVRLDGAVNIFTMEWCMGIVTPNYRPVYGYAPTATGDATPESAITIPGDSLLLGLN